MTDEIQAKPVDPQIREICGAVSGSIGAADAYEAAVIGILRVLRSVDSVRQCVEEELIRVESYLLAENINTAREEHFDLAARLIRLALGSPVEGPGADGSEPV